jgi:DNA mismatch repair protein MutS
MSDTETNILVKDYFKIQSTYEEKYGKINTIVLIQVGGFYEAYCTDTSGPNLNIIASKLDMVKTGKNKSLPISESNPYMMGFPLHAITKYLEMLVEFDYTVIVVDQVSPAPKPIRKVVGIYTPSTYIETTVNTKPNKYLMSINIIEEKDINKNLFASIGMTAVDLSTGELHIHESFSKLDDRMFSYDEAQRFIKQFSPVECVLSINMGKTSNLVDFTYEDLISWFEIDNINIYEQKASILKERTKINYQNSVLSKIYSDSGSLSPIEYLNLEQNTYARLALVNMLDYVYQHNEKLIRNLDFPKFYDNDKYIYLGNNALNQLNILQTDQNIKNTKYRSLYNVICKCNTIMGKRFFKNMLSNPLINKDEITERYNDIEKIVKGDHYNNISNFLTGIFDVERLHRKLYLQVINPFEFINLILSYHKIKDLYIYASSNIKKYNEDLSEIKSLINHCDSIFILDNMSNISINNDITNSFFQIGVNKDIDDLQELINDGKGFIDHLSCTLSNFIKDDKALFSFNKKGKKETDKDERDGSLIKTCFNERDGYYLKLTKRRYGLFCKETINVDRFVIGKTTVLKSELEFKEFPKSDEIKIFCHHVKDLSNNIIESKVSLSKMIKDEFKSQQEKMFNKFSKLFRDTVNFVSYIDFVNSGAKCVIDYNYCKPEIKEYKKSYFKAKDLRHPIVERINGKAEYVCHNISLGHDDDLDGILLYGVNSSGKSTLMKSIGVNIIMAQMGYYVAASSFEYCPYKSLFTRISGNDNIFKGLSSFMVEGIELRAILKRNNPNSLVICDEISKGTEVKSANIIVVYMLEKLAENKSSFISATHLHKLVEFERVQKLERVKPFHIGVSYDHINSMLIYDRKLSEGSGESYYGLKVCQFIMNDNEFNKRTQEIEQDIYNKKPIVALVKSKYNNNLYIDECELCKVKDKLETHHINFQKDCENGFIKSKPHIQKNDESNLVVVCSKCHDDIDRSNIIVHGYVQTSGGIKLEWERTSVKKDKKYKNKDLDIINKYIKYTSKQAKNILEKDHNIKIGITTINKIWKNEYV